MNANYSENQSWIVKAGGDVIKKQASAGVAALSPKEKLIYCLWIADYGMCNAGDLSQARILHARWQQEAVEMAKELSLEFTCESFSLPKATLQAQYFDRFERICDEIKRAQPGAVANGGERPTLRCLPFSPASLSLDP